MLTYKQIGQGIFGAPQSSQYGIVITSLNVEYQAELDNIRNSDNVTKSQYLNDDHANITIDAYIIGSTLPKVGDTISFSGMSINMLTYSGGSITSGVITSVTVNKSNDNYSTISINAIHYPDVSY